MLQRLISKTNHPYNNNPLTLEEFNTDYKTLKGYVEWKKINKKNGFSLYNFTYDNMTSFFNLIKYDTENSDELLKLISILFRSPFDIQDNSNNKNDLKK